MINPEDDSFRSPGMDAARAIVGLVLLVVILIAMLGIVVRPAHAQSPCDSLCARDSAAVVAGLYRVKGPGKRWLVAGAATLALAQLDRDRGGYRDTWRTFDKQAHAGAGSSIALATDDRTVAWRGALGACALGTLWEVGQMRPSGFPAAHRGQTLGFFSWRDAVATCGGAWTGVGMRALWRRVAS